VITLQNYICSVITLQNICSVITLQKMQRGHAAYCGVRRIVPHGGINILPTLSWEAGG